PQARPVTSRYEVTGASATFGLQKEQTVGANGLVAVVLDDDWLSPEEAQGQRQQHRPSQVNNISLTDQPPEAAKARSPYDAERQCPIVKPSGLYACCDRDPIQAAGVTGRTRPSTRSLRQTPP